jgi:aspartyl-tRNA(Asn)/glutamyl-tRNA(Gln) amidotransferase subunit A
MRGRRWLRTATASASASAAAAPRASAAASQLLPGASVAREISRQIADREKTAVQVATEWLARARAAEDRVQAFLAVTEERALEQAAAVDAAVARGALCGALTGVPVAFKDNLCTRGVATTAGSRVLEGYVPPYDATAVARLLAGGGHEGAAAAAAAAAEAAAAAGAAASSSSSSSAMAPGAVMLGKLNMDEFGMGSTTENSAYKATRNPWDPSRVPGGSSGGSAAAVAARQAVLALGSDTGGSIRQPASFCGVVGVKPTYGLVSRYGLVAYASSLDTVGPLAPTVEDAALALDAIAGPDPRDATSAGGGGGGGGGAAAAAGAPPSSSSASAAAVFRGKGPCASAVAATRLRMLQGDARPLSGKRVGIVRETVGAGVDPAVAAAARGAADALARLGAHVEEISLPTFAAGLPAYYVLAVAEASSNLSRFDGVRYGLRREAGGAGGGGGGGRADLAAMYNATRGEGLGAEVKRRILMGTYALSAGYVDAYYARAQRVRGRVRAEMAAALSGLDALVTPAAPTPAYRLGDKLSDPLAMWAGDLMTVNVNLSGLPAVVLPAGFAEQEEEEEGGGGRTAAKRRRLLPVGVQLVGRAFGEPGLLALAAALEASLDVAGKGGRAPLAAA